MKLVLFSKEAFDVYVSVMNQQSSIETVILQAMGKKTIDISGDYDSILLSFSDEHKKRNIVARFLYRVLSIIVGILYNLFLLCLSGDEGIEEFFGDGENLIDTKISFGNKKNQVENLEIVYKKQKMKGIEFNVGVIEDENVTVEYIPNLQYKNKLWALRASYLLFVLPGTALMLLLVYLLKKFSIILSILFLVFWGMILIKIMMKMMSESKGIEEAIRRGNK